MKSMMIGKREILWPELSTENESSESDEQELPIPTRKEALTGWETFKNWQRQKDDFELGQLVEKLDEYIGRIVLRSAAQSKITDFFRGQTE